MINILIIFSCSLLIISIAIKFNFLNVLSTILAILALLPIAVSVVSYFVKQPKIGYQITNFETQKVDGHYLYKFWVALTSENKAGVIESFIYCSEFGINPVPYPKSSAPFDYVSMLEETGFAGTARVGSDKSQLIYEKMRPVYMLAFQLDKKPETVPVKIVVDVSLDPMKQGFLGIFHNLFKYRLSLETTLDGKEQDGFLKNRYF